MNGAERERENGEWVNENKALKFGCLYEVLSENDVTFAKS